MAKSDIFFIKLERNVRALQRVKSCGLVCMTSTISLVHRVNWPLISITARLMPFIKREKKSWLLMWDLCMYLFSFSCPTWICDYHMCDVHTLLTVDAWMVVVELSGALCICVARGSYFLLLAWRQAHDRLIIVCVIWDGHTRGGAGVIQSYLAPHR